MDILNMKPSVSVFHFIHITEEYLLSFFINIFFYNDTNTHIAIHVLNLNFVILSRILGANKNVSVRAKGANGASIWLAITTTIGSRNYKIFLYQY